MRAALIALLLCSCAGQSRRTQARDDFRTLDGDQKFAVMKHSVLPQMSRVFEKHYDAGDPQMTCKSCHGENAEDVGYKMPNDLPAFDPAHMPDPNEEMARFMIKEVTPKMAALLGEPLYLYNDKTGTGFGCFSCHPKK